MAVVSEQSPARTSATASAPTSARTSFIVIARSETDNHVTGKLRIGPFHFENGITLPNVDVAFETWGRINASRDNAVVVCHALTGDAHCGYGLGVEGWWDELIGPGRAIDTNYKFVIASNVLGGCAGSSGPASLDATGKPYALQFPLVTVRDMVRAQIALADALGVGQIEMVIGGSLGGMQAWEWPFLAPGRVKNTIVIAAHPAFPPLAIGYNEAMRQAIVSDPAWQQGSYYGTGSNPVGGLMTARSIGMLTYRSQHLFGERFGRLGLAGQETLAGSESVLRHDPLQAFTQPHFAVESYLHHQGSKLHARFDANSYLYLTRAMDTHDVGRNRGGLMAAYRTLDTNLTVIGIDTDYLYAASGLAQAVRDLRRAGVEASYVELASSYGHDAFLLEQEQLGRILSGVERGEQS